MAHTWISQVLQTLVTFRVACQRHSASNPNFLLPRSRNRELHLKQITDRSSSSHNLDVQLLAPQQRGSKTRIFSKNTIIFQCVCVLLNNLSDCTIWGTDLSLHQTLQFFPQESSTGTSLYSNSVSLCLNGAISAGIALQNRCFK